MDAPGHGQNLSDLTEKPGSLNGRQPEPAGIAIEQLEVFQRLQHGQSEFGAQATVRGCPYLGRNVVDGRDPPPPDGSSCGLRYQGRQSIRRERDGEPRRSKMHDLKWHLSAEEFSADL
jgi:hypothetical protein